MDMISRLESKDAFFISDWKEIMSCAGLTDEDNIWWRILKLVECGASLDAAIALVKEVLSGWSWEARQSGTGDQGQATVWNPLRMPGDNQEQRAYNCASPQIALLLAMLRALAAGVSDA